MTMRVKPDGEIKPGIHIPNIMITGRIKMIIPGYDTYMIVFDT
jgi:hypothetical protein